MSGFESLENIEACAQCGHFHREDILCDVFPCPVCDTPLVECSDMFDENGDPFLECPTCNKR